MNKRGGPNVKERQARVLFFGFGANFLFRANPTKMESSKRQSGHSLSRNEVADLIERAKELVEDAHGILVRIDALPKSIDGILKFRKRVVAELEFLQNVPLN
jgi:hypothetical protein